MAAKRCVKVGTCGVSNGRSPKGCAKAYNLSHTGIRDASNGVGSMVQAHRTGRGIRGGNLKRPRVAKSDKRRIGASEWTKWTVGLKCLHTRYHSAIVSKRAASPSSGL